MEKVIKYYGKYLLAACVVTLLLGVLFFGMTDSEGNRGILRMIGAEVIRMETNEKRSEEFTVLQEELRIPLPTITCDCQKALKVGKIQLTDYIHAADSSGKELSFQLIWAEDPKGNEMTHMYQKEDGVLELKLAGIYTLEVSATDSGNRTTKTRIKLPVNW